MRISDWSSDVCSSDLGHPGRGRRGARSSDRVRCRAGHRVGGDGGRGPRDVEGTRTMNGEARPTTDRPTEGAPTEDGAKSPRRERSPSRPLCAGLLPLHAVNLGLTPPVMTHVSGADTWFNIGSTRCLAWACIGIPQTLI